ncbi:MAG: hypothetical protein EWM50_04980 [Gottschalkiaceae bacterium]|nr:MAG: hypothetical protein EWM50_04980 [Gottschalkiaceae bacterium]
MGIKIQVTETYDENGIPRNHNDIIKECDVEINNLPQIFLELARKASQNKDNQELVLSFPNDDANTILVEIYNGYRE